MVGVLNTGRTFPVLFSFCPSKSAESFCFTFDLIKANYEGFKPTIILVDWAAGLVLALPSSLPSVFL
jgi:hypothetical protein